MLDVVEDVVDILDAYRQSDEVGSNAGLTQLFVGELTMGVTGGVENAVDGVSNNHIYRYPL